MSPGPDVARAATWATACSGLLIAAQVAGKATRDALFLSSFEITSLPGVLIVTSVASIVAVLLTSGATTRWGPRRVFVGSALLATTLHLVAWALVSTAHERAAALLVYGQTSVLGAIGVSAFWSRVNETFDPRSARAVFARIAGGGTLGGLVGGLLAERVAAFLPVPSMLPLLATLTIGGALCSLRIRLDSDATPKARTPAPERDASAESASNSALGANGSALRTLASVSYLRDLALLVVVGTVAAALLDYVFKAEAAASFHRGPELLRAFAMFYAVAGLLTFVAQLSLSRWVLERGGIAAAVSTLPGVVAAGAIAALLVPGLASAAVARGAETVLRSSLFRSGYELFYTPIPPDEKRGTKPIIDVGFDRAGDVLGGAVAQGLLVVAPLLASRLMLLLAGTFGLVGVLVARRLARGYVQALERGLMTRALELDLGEAEDLTTKSTLLRTLGGMTLERTSLPSALAAARRASPSPSSSVQLRPSVSPTGAGSDAVTMRLAALRGGDAAAVRTALVEVTAADFLLVPQVIALLAWDDVAPAAADALRAFGPRIVGQLVDALVDPKSDFAVRRRVPRVLGGLSDRRALAGLVEGLADRRFEVRFQCARALAGLVKGELTVPRDVVLEAVERELKVGKRVWVSQRLLDGLEDAGPSPFVDEMLRDRASRSLEHVFTLLALVLPEQPLRVAFRGLHTDDRALRGTALEYLDSVLPDRIRELLIPLVELDVTRPPPRPAERVVADLLVSKESIDRRLVALHAQPVVVREAVPPPAGVSESDDA